MSLKDRLLRFMGRSEASSVDSSRSPSLTNLPLNSSTPTPATADTADPPPRITLSKTSHGGSLLTKTLAFRSGKNKQDKAQRALEDWEKHDAREWKDPRGKYPGHKSQKHQDMLRAFEWSFGRKSRDGEPRRSGSIWSGISPGASRAGSIDQNAMHKVLSNDSADRRSSSLGAKRSGTPSSRFGSRADGGNVTPVIEE